MNQNQRSFCSRKMYSRNFLDLSRASDTVNHNILLEKLKENLLKVHSENLKWFRCYLSNRKQFVSYNYFKKVMQIVKSVFSKMLYLCFVFLIFVNDLNDSIIILDPVFFADDTNLFCSDDDIKTLSLR